MKLTTARLKKLINEEVQRIRESEITRISHTDMSKSDPNDDLFQVMDILMDRAMKKMEVTPEQIDDFKMSKLSNKVVTKHMEMMIDELIETYKKESKFSGKPIER